MKNKNEKSHGFDRNPELILKFRAGDSDAGEELVRLNTPLVYSIAARFRDRGADMSDLVECGTLGLVKAIGSFDTERGYAFSTYAVPLIFGEIRRFLRDDGPIKISREQRRISAVLSRERQRRLNLGEPADLATIAAAVGVSVQDAASAMFSDAPVRSLDEGVGADDDSATLGSTIADEEEMDTFDRLALYLAIEKLSPQHRRLVFLRFFKDYSQTECAALLGLSQVKVSREEKKIMSLLHRELSDGA
ncbi:MAG: sigma-70 family RNA polymerase sigma factor [Clostridia bacterium]|nr:sigma-70 family RNA polymerase sigma factor [Clostridia bacterium]